MGRKYALKFPNIMHLNPIQSSNCISAKQKFRRPKFGLLVLSMIKRAIMCNLASTCHGRHYFHFMAVPDWTKSRWHKSYAFNAWKKKGKRDVDNANTTGMDKERITFVFCSTQWMQRQHPTWRIREAFSGDQVVGRQKPA
jgi:hypothetical protein